VLKEIGIGNTIADAQTYFQGVADLKVCHEGVHVLDFFLEATGVRHMRFLRDRNAPLVEEWREQFGMPATSTSLTETSSI
jgi:hypothetical protein